MLEIAVFLCGAVVMVIELTGSRVLAPYLGTSLVVWTSLIGIILASLSIGYWWGGRLADRRPDARLLGGIILISAFATAFVALIKTVVLGLLQAQKWRAAHSGHVCNPAPVCTAFDTHRHGVAFCRKAQARRHADKRSNGRKTLCHFHHRKHIRYVSGRVCAHSGAGKHKHPSADGRGSGPGLTAGGTQSRPDQGGSLRGLSDSAFSGSGP